ncbi:MAG: AAA family ATPase [Haliea sp.]
MSGLELRFLRDPEVIRAGETLVLPPSRKTRALLAYLALNPRPFRREQLCELLWEVPDDPRGSLRWSLSKLRRLVDTAERPRIIADRQYVRLDVEDVEIDVLALYSLAAEPPGQRPVDELEQAVGRFNGHFLEGLELSGFHDFHAWYIAEREQVNQSRIRLLQLLLDQLDDDPARALPAARELVTLAPYDEAGRSRLVRHLLALGRSEEAEQQFRLGNRMLEEVGAKSTGQLYLAWRGPPARAPSPEPEQASPVPVPDYRGAGDGTLIGRDAELAALVQALDAVREQSRTQFVLLRGDAGMGKTRLLDALLATAAGAGDLVLQASAFESEVIRPFALWIDALRQHDSATADRIFGKGAHQDRDQLFAALSGFLSEAVVASSVLLVFDDWHWCDESSAAALHYVARMNRQQPLLTVLSARDDELWDNTAVQQALRGLRRDGLLWEIELRPLERDFLCALIRSEVPGADCQRLAEQCGGNPLFALELARAELEGGSQGSLRELVRDRLARLDVDAGEVVLWAALIAPHIYPAALARVTGLASPRLQQALHAAERQGMLLPAGVILKFSHNLIARSVYQEISPARRRVMHRRVAQLLEQDTAVDLVYATALAHHSSLSGDPRLAARAMVAAGRLCLRFFANDDAVALARKGLQLADSLGDAEQVRVMVDLHDILLAAAPLDDWQEAASQYVVLAEQALDYGEFSHARLGYQMASYVRWMHGQWAQAREESLEAERVSRSACDRDQIVGMAEAAKCLALLERDLPQADAMSMEAHALAERQRISHYAIPMALGILRLHENRLQEAEIRFREARTLCKAAGDRLNEYQANEYLTMIAIEQENYRVARQRCATLLTLGDKLREGSEAPFARALEALCGYALGEPDGPAEVALAELRSVDAKYRLAYTLTRIALLDLQRGNHEPAILRAQEALQYASLLERATETLLAHLALALGYQVSGDLVASRRHRDALAALEGTPVAGWARVRVNELLPAAPATA